MDSQDTHDHHDHADQRPDEQPTQPDLSAYTLRLTEELYEALLVMVSRTVLVRSTCPRCGSPARGSFYSNVRDTQPWTHYHYMTVACLACNEQWTAVITHGGHGELSV